MNHSDKILKFITDLKFENSILPDNVSVMNPYFIEGGTEIKDSIKKFYKKFYSNNKKRKMILGINPGRHGAGVTGIPFTDTKRLNENCGIPFDDFSTYETSSVYVYEMIEAYGGPRKFYNDYYISAISPFGFVKRNEKGNEVNYNYYDDPKFKEDIKPFVVKTIKDQIEFGIDNSVVYCLGMGTNYKYLVKLNKEQNFFGEVIPLAHPRYIMQYKLKSKQTFIDEYLNALLN